jgi:hypothetical protein
VELYACVCLSPADVFVLRKNSRQIPNTQHLDSRNGNPIPTEEEEPLWMKMSVTSPCPAGSVMLRDSRAWHGGTPNLGKYVRGARPSAFGFAAAVV